VAIVVLGIAIAAQTIQLVRRLADPPSAPTVVAAAPTAAASRREASARAIISANLFGSATPVVVSGSNHDVVGGSTLTGTLLIGGAGRGYAFLRTPAGSRMSRTGEEVAPGIELVEVHADRVVVSSGGTLAELALPRDGSARVAGVVPGFVTVAAPEVAAVASAAPTPPRASERALELSRRSAERRAAARAREVAEEAREAGSGS
jgi:hypothetical protein